ncbi:hypothetical protein B0H13DRAFT_1867541 [Mycena leptocephala]|nr:hypothetical protein B0H13DRAFT_1867541 [Mycena leptocephala]
MWSRSARWLGTVRAVKYASGRFLDICRDVDGGQKQNRQDISIIICSSDERNGTGVKEGGEAVHAVRQNAFACAGINIPGFLILHVRTKVGEKGGVDMNDSRNLRQKREQEEGRMKEEGVDLNANLERQSIGRWESGDTARGRYITRRHEGTEGGVQPLSAAPRERIWVLNDRACTKERPQQRDSLQRRNQQGGWIYMEKKIGGEAEGQILTYEVDDRGSEGLQLDSIQVSANYAKYSLLDEISAAPSFNGALLSHLQGPRPQPNLPSA